MKITVLLYDGMPTTISATSHRVGGLNTILFNLIHQLGLSKSTEVQVVTRDTGTSPLEWGYDGCIPIHQLPAGKSGELTRGELDTVLPEFAMNFERFIHLSAPDIIYTAGSEAGYVMACLRSKGIGITWMHTNFATLSVRRVQVDGWELCTALEEPIGKRELACLAGCDLVLALSETDKQEITSVFGIPNSKVIVAPPGVDPYIFFPSSGFPAMPIVVSAGRMSAIKDYPFLLKAFSHTVRSSRRQDVQLTIIGGNNRERSDLGIPQLIRNMGLAKHVRLIDGVSQSRLAELFRQSRVFAGTSKHETFGLLPVEARACGLPFVVRRNSGYMATAVDGQGGYLADNIDPVDMGQRIDRILSLDEASWLELSRQAIKSSARFRYSEMARIFKEACKQCM